MRNNSAVITIFSTVWIASAAFPSWGLPLSPGDRVRVLTPLDDELPSDSRFRLSGVYEVNGDGTLQIPFLEPLPATGLEVAQVEKQMAEALVAKGFFRPEFLELSVKIVQWAPVQIMVAGETFRPGQVLVQAALRGEAVSPIPSADEPVTGSYSPERYLTAAIRNAGGLKPTADIRHIRLIRGKQEQVIDLSGILTGQAVVDVPLVAGDRVIVPKALTTANELVRPSRITPSHISVVLSNLIDAKTETGGRIETIDYGTRFSQAVVAAGCAGGSRSTNARRRAILVQTDRLTGQTHVVDRPVEALLNADTDAENPFLMPLDSVVCYDAATTTVSKIFRLITNILSPFFLIPRLFR